MTTRRRRCLFVTAAVLLAYLGSYIALSVAGECRPSQTGTLRYSGGLSVTDVAHWQPALARWEPFQDVRGNASSRGNLVGYLYSPLIGMDRAWWHRSQSLVDMPYSKQR